MNIAQYVTRSEDGWLLEIPLENEHFKGARIEKISMFISADEDNDICGDLAVQWDTADMDNNEQRDGFGLLMRNPMSGDTVTKLMSAFYNDGAYTARLRKHLMAVGFSKAAVADIWGSEWGMQEEGRASYDAYKVGDELRAAMANL